MRHIFLFINSLVLLTGCATLPTQEMSDARQAIKAAHGAKAEVYIPSGLLHAEKDLAQAEKDLAQGLFKQAQQHALSAKQRAVNAYEASMTLEHAKIIWQTIGNLDSHAAHHPVLAQAESAALHGDVDNILNLANAALQQGQETLNQVYLAQAKILMEKFKQQRRTLYPGETTILEAAQHAYEKHEGRQAFRLMQSLSITP
jgi:Domain of unknown function (DUF4398)